MSDYPYGYPFQGQPPQQQYPSYPPYGAGAYPPQPATGYGSQPSHHLQQPQSYPPATTNYHAASHSAYDYNASSIPGLGTPSNAPPPFAAPFNGSWSQPGYGASAPVPPPAPLPANNYSNPSTSTPSYTSFQAQALVPQNLRPGPQPGLGLGLGSAQQKEQNEQKRQEAPRSQPEGQRKEQPKPPPLAETESQDEGEISDSYFDDLYDDVPGQSSAGKEPAIPSAESTEDVAAEASDQDQEPNFYDTDMDEAAAATDPSAAIGEGNTHDTVQVDEETDRARSRSYSPHLSPAEIQQDSPPPKETLRGSSLVSGAQNEPLGRTVQPELSSGLIQRADDRVKGLSIGQQPAIAVKKPDPAPAPAPSKSFASVFEAHNEAKKAILRLLPHGVKYQTYIEEGFDGNVIKDLFTQLNLPSEPTPSVPTEKPITTPQGKENQDPKKQPSPLAQIDTMTKKQEERKDRIARLLAEKKAKAAAASSGSNAGMTTEPKSSNGAALTSTPSTPTTKLPVTRAEKDRLLQQKIEALHKAREAKNLVLKSASTQVSTPDAQRSAPPQGPAAATRSSIGPLSAENPPSKSATPQPALSAAQSPRTSSFPSGPRTAQQVNQRKRPVAADFMDYPPAGVKRPSLANRQNSSLVISISDDEDDDDDDVEMEVDSPNEDSPAPPQQNLTLPRRGPSIRDYPPLSNKNSAKQISSPLHGASTPGGKNANVDLKAREDAIANLRRKIEEAEARAKAKPKKGSVTPQTPSTGDDAAEKMTKPPVRGVATSSDVDYKNGPTAQLLQEAEAASTPKASSELSMVEHQPDSQSRVGAASTQLPNKTSKAAEKAERLRRMQEEMMRLQAEIDEDEAGEQDFSDDVEAVPVPAGLETSQDTLETPDDSFDHGDRTQATEVVSAPSSALEPDDASQNQPMDIDPPEKLVDELEAFSSDVPLSSHVASLKGTQPLTQPAAVPGAGKQQDHGQGISPSHLQTPDAFAAAQSKISGDYEPPKPDADLCDEGRTLANIANESELQRDVQVLENDRAMRTISTVNVPIRDFAHRQHTEISREVHVVYSAQIDTRLTNSKAANTTLPTPQNSLGPYESPLRYFHAFRFHPRYHEGVSGGLKSLTYSNRIDPKKEMCPDEWEGNDCPRGEACQFQHFQSIIPPDNGIILELGSSEEFTGEQKKAFNNGLREVVSSFQKSKVRDFRTIAQAIVEFRRKFLGDASKVLRLEGINI